MPEKSAPKAAKDDEQQVAGEIQRPMCGIVMPIAVSSGYSDDHWPSVEKIITEAIGNVGFDARLVSQATASGVIHQRIITNLYQNSLVVCDVSGRNPNVMFELGVRLAFDKPTIIIKDDETPFSFDISGIEHLIYPKSLRYDGIVAFKEELGKTILATSKAASENPSYSTFLKHITGVVPAKLTVNEVSISEYVSRQLEEIHSRLEALQDTRRLQSPSLHPSERGASPDGSDSEFALRIKILISTRNMPDACSGWLI